MLLHNSLKIFLTNSKFLQLILILHNYPLPYGESFSLQDSTHCQCNFLPFAKKITKMAPELFVSVFPASL